MFYAFTGSKDTSALHVYKYPYKALHNASGCILHIVSWDANNVQQVSVSIDAADLLHEFARWCALQVIDLWDAPKVVRDYLKTGDKSLPVAGKAVKPQGNDIANSASASALRVIITADAAEAALWSLSAAQDADVTQRLKQQIKLEEMVEAALEVAGG